ncbi:hypothetical protein KOW79_016295 [Hemibagrus wyckioides]|uniref:Podocalyxin n=1 Tax=Hemibagrus wyckioides TaxID=337641 RepID=A0A9D3NDV8_9TELE|nr:podocalyxin [Hemibagrus wyckioides]KAG7320442.1 hypothetical protein KOW79_016295 [Hemibagrus wyckioides]
MCTKMRILWTILTIGSLLQGAYANNKTTSTALISNTTETTKPTPSTTITTTNSVLVQQSTTNATQPSPASATSIPGKDTSNPNTTQQTSITVATSSGGPEKTEESTKGAISVAPPISKVTTETPIKPSENTTNLVKTSETTNSTTVTMAPVTIPVRITSETTTPVRITSETTTPVRITSETTTPVRITSETTTPVRITSETTTPVRITSETTTPVRITSETTTPVRITSETTTPVRITSETTTPVRITSETTTPVRITSEKMAPMKTTSATRKNVPKEQFTKTVAANSTGDHFENLCARFMAIINATGKCTITGVMTNDVIKYSVIKLLVDELSEETHMKTTARTSEGTPEERSDKNSMTLITILTSCGALALILTAFAVYCSCHRLSYRKNQQHLTEELQTVENGYHDNPTLEVMEVQPEMQEKKMALNGEFNDSWIVPFDNLAKEDILEEEDTHL